MRRTTGEKVELIRLVEGSDLSVRRTLRELRLNRSTFYAWYRRYTQRGRAAGRKLMESFFASAEGVRIAIQRAANKPICPHRLNGVKSSIPVPASETAGGRDSGRAPSCFLCSVPPSACRRRTPARRVLPCGPSPRRTAASINRVLRPRGRRK